eukprot:355731-Chlamydomonas_euryale.AAC.5
MHAHTRAPSALAYQRRNLVSGWLLAKVVLLHDAVGQYHACTHERARCFGVPAAVVALRDAVGTRHK